MKPFILLSYIIIYAFPANCFAQSAYPGKKLLPVLDKTKSYTSKKLDFETEVSYVPLYLHKSLQFMPDTLQQHRSEW